MKNKIEIEAELKKTRLIIDAQPNIVIITDGEKLIDANQTFLKFFGVKTIKDFLKKTDCICDFFINDGSNKYLQKVYPDGTRWIDILINEPEILHKAMVLNIDGEKTIFEVKANKLISNDGIDYGQDVVVFSDITTMENQATLIAEMEIPILEINQNTTLIPLIGILDSVKSQSLMENILISIKEKTTNVAIVDIEGIIIVDSAVAAHLIKITKATKLMGCTTILSGIAPEVAQTIVNLGINLDGINTTSTLKDAINLSKILENEK